MSQSTGKTNQNQDDNEQLSFQKSIAGRYGVVPYQTLLDGYFLVLASAGISQWIANGW